MKKISKLKIVAIVTAIIAIVFASYCGIHAYGNHKLLEKYGNGFTRNKLGDYTLNKDDVVFGIYKAPFLSLETNLSVSYQNIDLVIWCSLWSDELSYGIVVNDDEEEISYQIEVDDSFQAKDEDEQLILDKYEEDIQYIKEIIDAVWNMKIS